MNNIQVVGKITIENNKIQDIQADTLEIKEYMLSILKKTGEIDDVYIKEQGI